MGAQATKGIPQLGSSRDGHIYVQFDQRSYYPGETVTGRICLHLVNQVSGATLLLKMNAHEKVLLSETIHTTHKRNDRTEHQTTYKLKDEKQEFVNFSYPVYTWDHILPGQYAIPISFLLPQNLPGSFYSKGSGFLSEISYYVTAELVKGISARNNRDDEKLLCKEKFHVKSGITRPPGANAKEAYLGIKTCCKKQGNVGLVMTLKKDILGVGEKVRVVVDIDNTNCNIDIHSVFCEIVQSVTLKAQGKTVRKEVSAQRQTGSSVAKGQTSEQIFELTFPECQEGEIDENLGKNRTDTAYKLAHQGFPQNTSILTTKGHLIESTHQIRVYCSMDKSCTTSPSLCVPITLIKEQIQDEAMYAPPLEWNPEVLSSVNIAANFQDTGLNYAPTLEEGMFPGNMDEFNQMLTHKKNI